jgi:hypothetical protein
MHERPTDYFLRFHQSGERVMSGQARTSVRFFIPPRPPHRTAPTISSHHAIAPTEVLIHKGHPTKIGSCARRTLQNMVQ